MRGIGSRLCTASDPAGQLPSIAALLTAARTPATASQALPTESRESTQASMDPETSACLPAGDVCTFACTEGMRWRCKGPLTDVCICTGHHSSNS